MTSNRATALRGNSWIRCSGPTWPYGNGKRKTRIREGVDASLSTNRIGKLSSSINWRERYVKSFGDDKDAARLAELQYQLFTSGDIDLIAEERIRPRGYGARQFVARFKKKIEPAVKRLSGLGQKVSVLKKVK